MLELRWAPQRRSSDAIVTFAPDAFAAVAAHCKLKVLSCVPAKPGAQEQRTWESFCIQTAGIDVAVSLLTSLTHLDLQVGGLPMSRV